jgi:hypothetical protein
MGLDANRMALRRKTTNPESPMLALVSAPVARSNAHTHSVAPPASQFQPPPPPHPPTPTPQRKKRSWLSPQTVAPTPAQPPMPHTAGRVGLLEDAVGGGEELSCRRAGRRAQVLADAVHEGPGQNARVKSVKDVTAHPVRHGCASR